MVDTLVLETSAARRVGSTPTRGTNMTEQPYLEKTIVIKVYNPDYGDDRDCQCGHKYYRHFDTYENMEPVGCKYCMCFEFSPCDGTVDMGVSKTPAQQGV